MGKGADRRSVLAALAAMPLAFPARAADARDAVVARLIEAVRKEYQDGALALRMAEALAARRAAGAYDAALSDAQLAERLNADLHGVVDDKHLAIMAGSQPADFDYSGNAPFQAKINYGVQAVRRLPGNIGLIELNFFPKLSFKYLLLGRYAAAMTLVAQTRALIVDVRAHNGGEPACVAYFASYFFERRPFLINEIRYRHRPADQYHTTPTPRGPLYGERRPVFVTTSANTFSGAEEFAYDLQALKRATIVGEVTGGGANPNDPFDLGGGFTALIPTGRAVNPVTHTNWEAVGVKPDVAVPAAKAVDVAQRLALEAALAQAANGDEKASIQQALSALPPN